MSLMSLMTELPMYWLDGAVRALDGQRRGLSDHYPLGRGSSGRGSVRGCLRRRQGQAAALRGAAAGTSHTARLRLFADQAAFYTRYVSGPQGDGESDAARIRRLHGRMDPAGAADSWRGFDAYVNRDLCDGVRAVQNLTGTPKVNMLGYCFGGL